MEIDKITTLSLQPDDVLVLNYEGKLSDKLYHHLKATLERVTPGHKVLIIEQGMTLQVLKPALKWTSDLPTQEGWYWHRYVFDDLIFVEPLRVFTDEVPFYCERPGVEDFNDLSDVLIGGDEWYGPIEPPEYEGKE